MKHKYNIQKVEMQVFLQKKYLYPTHPHLFGF